MTAKGTKGEPQTIGISPPRSVKEQPQATPRRKSTKGQPSTHLSSTNLSKRPAGKKVILNFEVTPEFKRQFKMEATANDMSMLELFKQMYDLWKEQHL